MQTINTIGKKFRDPRDTEKKIESSAKIGSWHVAKVLDELEKLGFRHKGRMPTAGKHYPGLYSRTHLWCRKDGIVHALDIKVNQTSSHKGKPCHKNCLNQYKDVLGSVLMQRKSPCLAREKLELRSSMLHIDLVSGDNGETATGHEHDDRKLILEEYGVKTLVVVNQLLVQEMPTFVDWWLNS